MILPFSIFKAIYSFTSIKFTIYKITFINFSSILLIISTFTVFNIIYKCTNIIIAIFINFFSLPIAFIIYEFSFIFNCTIFIITCSFSLSSTI
jgi:hypothetical protein